MECRADKGALATKEGRELLGSGTGKLSCLVRSVHMGLAFRLVDLQYSATVELCAHDLIACNKLASDAVGWVVNIHVGSQQHGSCGDPRHRRPALVSTAPRRRPGWSS